MKSQQFNKLFLPKTEKNAEKMFILEKKKKQQQQQPVDPFHTKFSNRESTKPRSISRYY